MSVEVSGEKRVRTSKLASPTLSAVNKVFRDLRDFDLPLLHRYNVGVKGRRRVIFVSGHLHDGTDFAAEFVARTEATVGGVEPLCDERVLERGAGCLRL